MRKSILLVDDELVIRTTFSEDLADGGYEVSTAENGEVALEKLKNNQYNLVVTDLMMEGLNGLQVLQEVKKIDPEIGVIILTGFGDMNSAIEALRLGADDYLLKPCKTEELLIRISRCLDKQEANRKIKVYEAIIPVCCECGVIRDDTGVEKGKGEWKKVDKFLVEKTTAKVSHTYCPKCFQSAMNGLIGGDK